MRDRQTAEALSDEPERSAAIVELAAPAAPRALSVGRVLALQRTAGNHSVAALISQARRSSLDRCPECGGTCKDAHDKQEHEHDEEHKDERDRGALRAKMLGGAQEPTTTAPTGDNYRIIEEEGEESAEEETAEQPAETVAPEGPREKRVEVGVQQVLPGGSFDAEPSDLRAKATTTVRGGAAASQAMGAGVYGLTWEESVDISISVKKVGATWQAVCNKLTGHYSQQTRLLPGQSEVTGVAGNTTLANYCQQVTGLNTLGNTAGNPWYMQRAVKVHEDVHAAHFGPGLVAAEPGITAGIEAVTIADVAGWKTADALTAMKADANFQAAAAAARGLWVAQNNVLLAGDHAPGGPTDTAEHTVVDPVVNRICAHAKKQGWAACPVCPP
jgi:hypothetical protein